tara:strand:+ start:406 stop:624 length:219 start_codon:yes stop_codon:yes gene_type:complete
MSSPKKREVVLSAPPYGFILFLYIIYYYLFFVKDFLLTINLKSNSDTIALAVLVNNPGTIACIIINTVAKNK